MPVYQLKTTAQTEVLHFVRADSESAARQAWIDDAFDYDRSITYVHDEKLVAVEEIAHDELCCCPVCEGSLKC